MNAIAKAGADARVKDLEVRLADILAGVSVLSGIEAPDLPPDAEKDHRLALSEFRARLRWVADVLRRQLTDALDVACGDAEPRPRKSAPTAPVTIPFRIVPLS